MDISEVNKPRDCLIGWRRGARGCVRCQNGDAKEDEEEGVEECHAKGGARAPEHSAGIWRPLHRDTNE